MTDDERRLLGRGAPPTAGFPSLSLPESSDLRAPERFVGLAFGLDEIEQKSWISKRLSERKAWRTPCIAGRSRHAAVFSRHAAFGSPDGVDAQTGRTHQKAAENRPQHRTAG
jgi:hypothetical protein